jgi:hypothetical protein
LRGRDRDWISHEAVLAAGRSPASASAGLAGYNQELLNTLRDGIGANRSWRMCSNAIGWVDAQLDRLRHERGFDPKAEGGEMPRLILSLAASGQVILVGRGAGYYLPRATSLHVRVVAPLPDRIAHMADWSRMTREAAADLVRQRDERRAEFLLKHFGRRSTDVYDFDLVLNSGLLVEETCADVILAALNAKQDALEGDSRLD